jgi:hypothetical protein
VLPLKLAAEFQSANSSEQPAAMSLQDKLNAAAANFGSGEFQDAYDEYVLALAEVSVEFATLSVGSCWRVGRRSLPVAMRYFGQEKKARTAV